MSENKAITHSSQDGGLRAAADRLYGELAHVHGLTKSARPALAEVADALAEGTPVAGGRRPAPWSRALIEKTAQLARRPPRAEDVVRRLREKPDDFAVQTSLRMAALLRLAAGLRGTGPEAGQGGRILHDETGLVLTVVPDHAGYDPRRAVEAADLWNAVMPRPVSEVRISDPTRGTAPRLIAPEDTLAKALYAVLERQFDLFTARAYGAGFAQDPEYVHELRVATRRMRSALRVFRRALNGGGAEIKAGLKGIAGVLGEARDTDVFLDWLKRYTARRTGRRNALLQRLIRREEAHRRHSAAAVRETFRGPDTERFVATLRRRLAVAPGSPDGVPLAGKHADTPLAAEAPRLLSKRLKAVLRFGRKLEALGAEDLHALRIACKRLRYSAEFLQDVYPDGLSRVIRPATRLQDFLGNVHDADVYAARIETYLARRRTRLPEDGAEIQALRRELSAWRDGSLKSASAEWRRFSSPKRQRTIAQLVQAPYAAAYPRIEAAAFGSITVDGAVRDGDRWLTADGKTRKRRKKAAREVYGTSHVIGPIELRRVCRVAPAVLFVGTGYNGMVQISAEGRGYLDRQHITVVTGSTATIAEAYNSAPGPKAAILHVTC